MAHYERLDMRVERTGEGILFWVQPADAPDSQRITINFHEVKDAVVLALALLKAANQEPYENMDAELQKFFGHGGAEGQTGVG